MEMLTRAAEQEHVMEGLLPHVMGVHGLHQVSIGDRHHGRPTLIPNFHVHNSEYESNTWEPKSRKKINSTENVENVNYIVLPTYKLF